MKQEETDEKYMRRCLQLARNGQLLAKPNPMVGEFHLIDIQHKTVPYPTY